MAGVGSLFAYGCGGWVITRLAGESVARLLRWLLQQQGLRPYISIAACGLLAGVVIGLAPYTLTKKRFHRPLA